MIPCQQLTGPPNPRVLWFLWLNVMLFDVRFVVDSTLERSLRAIHLGATVDVSVIAPQYSPADQIKHTFQALCTFVLYRTMESSYKTA